ncbi:MAG: DUF86 domain-containing protein [Oscillospiraceae bacterium]|jgi:uncharacterized protein with HEPN domain|nr:DUF86 domain-containing protein [Oscillospiraceae bacterium]
MVRRDRIVLQKLLAESTLLAELLNGIPEHSFLQDEKTKRATSMTLINIGELVKQLTDELRAENRHIPWKEIAGLRDVTAHRYFSMRWEDVYATASIDVPALAREIRKLLGIVDD